MKLGIISDSRHYYMDGKLYNHNSLLVKQLECWAKLFDDVIICAPLLSGQPPATSSTYRVPNIHLLPIVNAGGDTLAAKFDLVCRLPGWWHALQELLSQVDAVHIRCPNNISILGLIALRRTNLFSQAIYTGAWFGDAYMNESPTYRLQQWYLRHLFRGPVAVYGKKLDDPSHIVSSFSPSYSLSDWEQERAGVDEKIKKLGQMSSLRQPIRLVSVGMLDRRKNHQFLIRSMKRLVEKEVLFKLDIIGDGFLRNELQNLINDLGLQRYIVLQGRMSHGDVRRFYRNADFVIQTPLSEGYGKVPNEAFFHGAIPILSDVNLSRQIVDGNNRGRCINLDDIDSVAFHVSQLASDPSEIISLIENGRLYALTLTLESWQAHIKQMLEQHWRVEFH